MSCSICEAQRCACQGDNHISCTVQLIRAGSSSSRVTSRCQPAALNTYSCSGYSMPMMDPFAPFSVREEICSGSAGRHSTYELCKNRVQMPAHRSMDQSRLINMRLLYSKNDHSVPVSPTLSQTGADEQMTAPHLQPSHLAGRQASMSSPALPALGLHEEAFASSCLNAQPGNLQAGCGPAHASSALLPPADPLLSGVCICQSAEGRCITMLTFKFLASSTMHCSIRSSCVSMVEHSHLRQLSTGILCADAQGLEMHISSCCMLEKADRSSTASLLSPSSQISSARPP